MSRALIEGAYLAAWSVALLAVLALAEWVLRRHDAQRHHTTTPADRYAADEARRRVLDPPGQPRSPLSESERARFAAMADHVHRRPPPTTPGNTFMDKITFLRRRLALLTATNRTAPFHGNRWMQRLAPTGRGGALHIAHPDTGECLCERATKGPARPGDRRQVCDDCHILQNALANAEIQARYHRSWDSFAEQWKRALADEGEVPTDVKDRVA